MKWHELPTFLSGNGSVDMEPGAVVEHLDSGNVLIVFKVANGLQVFRKGVAPLRGISSYSPLDDIMILKGDVYDE